MPHAFSSSRSSNIISHVLCTLLIVPLAAAGACQRDQPHAATRKLALGDPLPNDFPRETKLRIGDPKVQKMLELSGLIRELPCEIEWQNMTGGPQTLEAFRAGALDAGSVGDTPPIHAAFTGLPVKIIAAQMRDKPSFQLAVAPSAQVESLADLGGKRIAYAPGQAQGALVLRALAKANLTPGDVTFVELTSSEFKDALGSKQVEVAPLSGPILRRYLKEHRAEGAHAIAHGTRDSLSFLYVRTPVLEDAAKAAALRAYVRLRTRAQLWASEHAEQWSSFYYVKDQGLSVEDARAVIDVDLAPRYPADWREVIALTQETIDLLARATGREPFKAESIFDVRYQAVGAEVASGSSAAKPAADAIYAGAEKP
jgi:sulfonate transport system substrate-binding protein